MTDDELIEHYAEGIPVDQQLLEPLGLVMWAAIRLHSGVRDTIGLDLGPGLSDAPFDLTLGQAITELVKAADAAGEPWKSEIESWRSDYGKPALDERNSIAHAIAHTASDGKQALKTPRRHGGKRIQVDDLRHAAGHLVLASVRLDDARDGCRKTKP